MACPYFVPREKSVHPSRPAPARSPLGGLYSGTCDADPFHIPGADELYHFCNVGYARGLCPQFPIDAEADAVRFTLHRERLLFVLEKDHAPVRHGELPGTGGVLDAQGRAFTDNLSR